MSSYANKGDAAFPETDTNTDSKKLFFCLSILRLVVIVSELKQPTAQNEYLSPTYMTLKNSLIHPNCQLT